MLLKFICFDVRLLLPFVNVILDSEPIPQGAHDTSCMEVTHRFDTQSLVYYPVTN